MADDPSKPVCEDDAAPGRSAGRPALHVPLPAALIGLGLMAAPVASQAQAVNDHYATPMNTVLSGVNVTANDVIGNATAETYVIGTGPQHGTAMLDIGGALTYTPSPGYRGPDAFQYLLTWDNSTATVFVDVGTTSIPALSPLALAALSAGVAGLAFSRRRRRS